MANRYTYTSVVKDTDTNKSYMQTTIYPKIKASDNDFYIISEAGDRLDLLAKKYYNNTSLWWIIAVANNLNDGNFFVEEGLQLRIPFDIAKISSELKRINE
jgi:phage tail protein X